MALAVTVTSVNKIQRDFLVRGTIVASGNYPTGGDTIDFTQATYRLGVDGIKSSSGPSDLRCWSEPTATPGSTTQFLYRGIVGSAQNNCGMQVITGSAAQSAGAELAAGAYPAGVTGDTIRFEAYFPSL